MVVPLPIWVRAPVPLMTPPNVDASVRLKASVLFLSMTRTRLTPTVFPQLQLVGSDCRAAGVAVRARQYGSAAANLGQGASPADDAAERRRIRPVEGQRPVFVHDADATDTYRLSPAAACRL